MKIGLPDGSVARIEYQGDVAPKVTFAPVSHGVPTDFFSPFASLAALDRFAAEVDQQSAAMIREVGALQNIPSPVGGRPDLAGFKNLPSGTVQYRFVSASDGRRTCDRSVEMSSYGPAQKPKVVLSSSGDCASMSQTPTQAGFEAWAASSNPGPIEIGADKTADQPHTNVII
jgi:hypothetical protein